MESPSPEESSAPLDSFEAHWLEWGPRNGPLAVAVHGFPDTPHTWRHLGPALAEQGWHVVAPWLRGYAPSTVPTDGNYRIGALVGDVTALAEHFDGDDAVLIGHDWGAITGYAAVASAPERFRKLVALAVPPLGTVMAGFLTYRQIRRSWYMFVFQHELAEGIVAADDLAFIDGLWAEWSPGYDATEDLEAVKNALRDPANLRAAIGYYRAMLGPTDQAGASPIDAAVFEPSPVPTLYVHGSDDGCMGAELVGDAIDALPTAGSRVEIIEGVGHFAHLEKPEIINDMIAEFLEA